MHVDVMCLSYAGLGGSDTTLAESTLYTIRVPMGGGCIHISKISSATIVPPHTGLTQAPQLTLSHDRDLKYTTGSGSSDGLLCSVSQTGDEWCWGGGAVERKRKRKADATDAFCRSDSCKLHPAFIRVTTTYY